MGAYTALVFTCKEDTKLHIKEFRIFMRRLLTQLAKSGIGLILFGNIAKNIKRVLPSNLEFQTVETLHPYNIGFIVDKKVQEFFKSFALLHKEHHL